MYHQKTMAQKNESCGALADIAIHGCLSRKHQALLTAPHRWKLLASPRAVPPCTPTDGTRRRWSRQHGHSHGHIELLVVLEGHSYFGWRGQVYPLRPGHIVLLRPGEEHDTGYPRSSGRGVHLWISMLQDHYVVHCVELWGKGEGFRPIGERLLGPEETGVLPSCLARQTAGANVDDIRLKGVLMLLLAAVAERGLAPPSARGGFQRDVVIAIQEHIRQTAGRQADLANLARIAGYSKYHFLRVFRRQTGQTPQEFIDTCRRARARELLGQGFSKRAVSEALGFSHPSSYRRWERIHMDD